MGHFLDAEGRVLDTTLSMRTLSAKVGKPAGR